MAVVKVFDVNGSKTLLCFEALVEVPYDEEEDIIEDEPVEKNPFE